MTPQYSRPRFFAASSERGAALVLALLVLALLMTLVLEFDRSVRLEHRAAGNYRDATAAFYLAKTGLAIGRALLEEDALTAGGVDHLDEPWALEGQLVPIGQGSVRVAIIDEERFFPINALVTGSTPKPDRIDQFRRLLRALGIDERITDAVADWIDEDHNAYLNGAENDYYESLSPPYHARNGPIENLDELRFIKGVTEEHYRRLAPHLTTVVIPPPVESMINLNTADSIVLRALHDDMAADLIERLMAERPFESMTEVNPILGGGLLTAAVNRYAGLTSRYFTIEAEGTVKGTSKVVTIQIDRNSLSQKPRWVRTPA